MSQLTISPVVPPEFTTSSLVSSSAHINEARFEEVSPVTSASSYSYTTNSRLEFLINSSSEFVDFINSYIRFDLEGVVLTTAGSDDTTKALSVGGAHSLFREVRIEASNGTLIQRIPRYNKWYAMMSQSLPQDYVEQVGAYYGDSVGDANVTHLGGSAVQSAREYYPNTATASSIVCCFQPALPLLMLPTYFPISFVRGGIRVIFELEAPQYVLYRTAQAGFVTSITGAAYQINNPRWVCRFVQPSNDIMQSYIQMFNGGGIHYTFKGYSHFLNQVAAGNSSLNAFQMNVNVRSADSVYSFIQSTPHETISSISATGALNTGANDSIGEFLKTNLSQYQFYSGATRFPLSRPVDMTDNSNSEALQHYLTAVDKQGSSLFSLRCNPEEWQERSTHYANTDSLKLVLAAKLGRGDDDYSGLDLSLIPLTGEYTFDAAYSQGGSNQVRYIHAFIGYTSTLSISNEGIFVRV